MEFSIPWIFRWIIEVGTDSDDMPCLFRRFHTKFWPKLNSKGLDGKLIGQELLDSIQTALTRYSKNISEIPIIEESHFAKITKKIQIQKGGILSQEELIAA